MEYVIRLDDAPADLAAIERQLLDLDPAALLDRDAASGALRCSTSALAVELMLVFAQALGFQTCLLSGCLTLVIMNLPTIIRTTQESLKTVPQGYREGALGLGAGKWHIIRTIVLPCSIDGIVTGCILAVGRIVGESAALLFTAGAAEVIAKGVAKAYTSNGATLSVLLYLRAFEDGDFDSAWAIGAVLLVLVLVINLAARLAKTKLKQKQ